MINPATLVTLRVLTETELVSGADLVLRLKYGDLDAIAAPSQRKFPPPTG